jgi:gliding motility-associated-like protein
LSLIVFKGSTQCVFNGVLSISNNDSICPGETYNLIATGAFSYNWTPSILLSNPNISFPTTSPNQTTTYYVTAFDGAGCSTMDSVEIFVHPTSNVNAGFDDSICPGSSTQLNASGGINYTWIVNNQLSNFLISNPLASPVNTTEYIVEIIDSNSCTINDSVIINVYDSAKANAGFNVSICANDSYLLQASGGVSYQWEPSLLVNHPNSASALSFPDDDMNFTVEVTDSNGCKDLDSVQILVFKINTSNDTVICKGDSVQLSVSGDPATNFEWTPHEGVSDSASYQPWFSPNLTTSYVVSATNSQGCIDFDTVTIDIPIISSVIDSSLTAGCDGFYVDFINSSSSDLSFSWIFSDGSTSNEQTVEKIFDFNSNFDAELIVEDDIGCISSSFLSIVSLSLDSIFNFDSYKAPNVFTPNGDGKNDQFIIEVPGKLYECTDLVIYNRWGQIQFISTGNNLSWDGRNNVGKIVPNGTYFYTISIKDKSYNGSISIYK